MLQNTVWRGTSLAGQRFHSDLAVPNFMLNWLGLTLLTIITPRPLPSVRGRDAARMRIEAMSWTGTADDLVAVLREGSQRAVGS